MGRATTIFEHGQKPDAAVDDSCSCTHIFHGFVMLFRAVETKHRRPSHRIARLILLVVSNRTSKSVAGRVFPIVRSSATIVSNRTIHCTINYYQSQNAGMQIPHLQILGKTEDWPYTRKISHKSCDSVIVRSRATAP